MLYPDVISLLIFGSFPVSLTTLSTQLPLISRENHSNCEDSLNNIDKIFQILHNNNLEGLKYRCSVLRTHTLGVEYKSHKNT